MSCNVCRVHATYNKIDKAYFHTWTEDEGRRGVMEVCSSLPTFFNASGIGDETTKLVAWSGFSQFHHFHSYHVFALNPSISLRYFILFCLFYLYVLVL